MLIIKRDGSAEQFNWDKIDNVITKAFMAVDEHLNTDILSDIKDQLYFKGVVTVEDIQDQIEDALFECGYPKVGKAFIRYRDEHNRKRSYVNKKKEFIETYKNSSNTANATIDDNSNVGSMNIGVLNAEIHKSENIDTSRGIIQDKLYELFPDTNLHKQYIRDLESHIIYKHDESSFCGPIAPYCVSCSMYPFLLNGLSKLGGQSTKPTNLDSYCGMYVNLIFAISAQFAGAVATPEFLVYFDYFAKKEWGEDYWQRLDEVITAPNVKRVKTIGYQIRQYFQQVIHSINQPAAARGMQSAFVNFALFDESFFHGMFDEFYFPDGVTQPQWESVNTLQHIFMKWFNKERLTTILTFPVVSYALVYKDNKFLDEDTARFVAEELSEGNSFFIYISDTVDSLSSCCFDKNQKVLWKSSTEGVKLTTLEELHNTKWNPEKKNLKIFHNGSWVSGRSIKLPHTKRMYKVTTFNNKEFIMTDNHINVTLEGEKQTSELTTNDYLMFNTMQLQSIPDNDENLSYAQGFVVGAFLSDGSFGSTINGTTYDINFSLNVNKYQKVMEMIDIANKEVGGEGVSKLNEVYNNVYPVRISSKQLAAFIMRWTNWERGTLAYNKSLNLNCLLQSVNFRQGILDGWYHTDGGNSNRCYTTSKELAEDMEVLITSLGLQSIINVSDRTDEKVVIRDKEYDRNYPLYCIRWYEPANHRANKDSEHSWIKKNNSIYFKIKSIEEVDYSDDVYCIECKNQDEPYFTLPCGLITHNCRLKNKIQTKEFNFTNGNMGVN